MINIPFNKPYLHGKELVYIAQAVASGKISGDGLFTKKCHSFFQEKYGFLKALLTTSCTDALEMCAILLRISPGDEIIVPSFTFVSTANAFALHGAKIVFADSTYINPNIDVEKIEELITPRTKAIVIVHYAGVSCDMNPILALAKKHGIAVVEDAAQAIHSFYEDRPLGGIGDLGTFSFHETKNIISGEGGLLIVNNPEYRHRSEIIWEKGTNRSQFFRGEVDKYGWIDVGSSFLPSEIISAYLFAQLQEMDNIQQRRLAIWQRYFANLKLPLASFGVTIPDLPNYATNNAHMFYIVCNDYEQRSKLISHLKSNGIHAVFHYLPLHSSAYFKDKHDGRILPHAEKYADCLLRLPFYMGLTDDEVDMISDQVISALAKK